MCAQLDGERPAWGASDDSIPGSEIKDIHVVEQIDPDSLDPGGIDTCIANQIKYSGPETRFSIIGVTTNRKLGKWTTVSLGGETVRFLPVARVDRNNEKKIIPHSLLLAFGLVRYARLIPRAGRFQAHRVEVAMLMRIMNRKYSIFIHNRSENLTNKTMGSDSLWRYVGFFYRKIEIASILRASSVAIFSHEGAIALRRVRPDIFHAQTSFDPEIFRAVADESPSKGTATKVRILWVGRLDTQKDPILAVAVASELRTRRFEFVLTVVGRGEMARGLTAEVERLDLGGDVVLAGPLSQLSVARLMRQSDLLLMTSRYEGSPTVLIEAQACGLPVIATEESDPDRILVNGENGFSVENRSVTRIADAIACRGELSSQKAIRAVEHRSSKQITQDLIDLTSQP